MASYVFIVGYTKPNGLNGPPARLVIRETVCCLESLIRPRKVFRTEILSKADIICVHRSGWADRILTIETVSGGWKLRRPNIEEILASFGKLGYVIEC